MSAIHVAGIGVFLRGFPDLGTFRAGRPDPAALEPACEIVSSRLRRGTSLLTRMAVHAVEGAGRAAGIDLSTAATVFGSAVGEIDIAVRQIEVIRRGAEPISPMLFKNSVHNTGSGVFSIAAGNHGFTTAVAAGWATVPMVLLEAMALLRSGAGPVIAVVADEPLPPPLDRGQPYGPLAVAFALTASPPARSEGSLDRLAPEPAPAVEPPEAPADVWSNPCASALHLVAALDARRTGRVGLTREGAPWSIEVQP